MGKSVSLKQSHQVMSIFANNTNWSEVNSVPVQQFINNPILAGEKFMQFLQSDVYKTLKFLELLNSKIYIPFSGSFSRDEFLASELGVKIHQLDSFNKCMVPELSEAIPAPVKFIETIPAFSVELTSYKLTKNMYDREIRSEIGLNKTFTPNEALAIIFTIISKQPNGEVGDFENTGHVNIFYVRLKSGEIVVVGTHWDSSSHEWVLFTPYCGDDDWIEGSRVFVRNLS